MGRNQFCARQESTLVSLAIIEPGLPVSKRGARGVKGEFVERNFIGAYKTDIRTFIEGLWISSDHFPSVNNKDCRVVLEGVDPQKISCMHVHSRLLFRFADGGFADDLTAVYESAGKCPESFAGVVGSLEDDGFPSDYRDDACCYFGVKKVDMIAVGTRAAKLHGAVAIAPHSIIKLGAAGDTKVNISAKVRMC